MSLCLLHILRNEFPMILTIVTRSSPYRSERMFHPNNKSMNLDVDFSIFHIADPQIYIQISPHSLSSLSNSPYRSLSLPLTWKSSEGTAGGSSRKVLDTRTVSFRRHRVIEKGADHNDERAFTGLDSLPWLYMTLAFGTEFLELSKSTRLQHYSRTLNGWGNGGQSLSIRRSLHVHHL